MCHFMCHGNILKTPAMSLTTRADGRVAGDITEERSDRRAASAIVPDLP